MKKQFNLEQFLVRVRTVCRYVQGFSLVLIGFSCFGLVVLGCIDLYHCCKERKHPEEEVIVEVVEEQPQVEEIVEIEIPPTREQIMFEDFEALTKIEDKKDWYLAYKGFLEDYPEFDRGSSLYDRYNDEEIYMMQRVIETEVYGCDFDAKANVASVILNRIEGDNNFPDDAITVCTAPGQFVYSRKQISEDTKLALEYAAEIEDTTNGALYFNSMAPMDSWNGRTRIFTDHVGHSFY